MGECSWPQRLRGSSVAVTMLQILNGEGLKRRNGLDASIVSQSVFKLKIYFWETIKNFCKNLSCIIGDSRLAS
jgi:hypothetical protein